MQVWASGGSLLIFSFDGWEENIETSDLQGVKVIAITLRVLTLITRIPLKISQSALSKKEYYFTFLSETNQLLSTKLEW